MDARHGLALAPPSAVFGDADDGIGDLRTLLAGLANAPLANVVPAVSPGSAVAGAYSPPATPSQIAVSPPLNFGVSVFSIHAGSSIIVAPSNAARQFLLLQNQDKTNPVQIGFQNAPSPAYASGVLIGPGSNMWMDSKVPVSAVWAASAPGVATAVIVAVVTG